jgi:hypothetical protein
MSYCSVPILTLRYNNLFFPYSENNYYFYQAWHLLYKVSIILRDAV